MTLRVALVIDGDPSGAKKALEETAAGIEKLGAKAAGAAKPTSEIAAGVDAIGRAGPGAAAGIERTGKAAAGAAPSLGIFKAAATGLAAGLAAGVIAGGIAVALEFAAGKASDYAQSILGYSPDIERDLKSHAGLIGKIRDAYAEASGAASSYGNNSRDILRFGAQQNIGRLERDAAGAGKKAFRFAEAQSSFAELQTGQVGPFDDALKAFRADLRDGKADVIAFRNEVGKIAGSLPEESEFRKAAEAILADTEKAAKAQEELARARDLLKGLAGDAEAASTALGGNAEKYRLTGEAAAGALPALREYDQLVRSIAGGAPSVADFTGPRFVDRQFAAGGWTGPGPASRIAGFVHGNEYVMDAATTARIGVGNLDAIRRGVAGYAAGGPVSGLGGGSYVSPFTGSGISGGGNSPVAATAADFQLLRGSLHQFLGTLSQGATAGQAFGGVLQSLSQRFLDFSLNALDRLLLGSGGQGGAGLLGSLFDALAGNPVNLLAGTGHTGAVIGASPMRSVAASVFASAPRLHGGGMLGADEVPFIGKVGEEIGWPGDLRQKYGGQTIVNNFHIETPSPRAFAESKSMVVRAAGRIVGRAGRYS